jgi:magnesium transporter
MMKTGKRFFKIIASPLDLARTKKILHVNPTKEIKSIVSDKSKLALYTYDAVKLNKYDDIAADSIRQHMTGSLKKWLNVDIVHAGTIAQVQKEFNIHALIVEDILNANQRPKVDEAEDQIYCVMQMLYFNEIDKSVESEQVSFVLGKHFLLTFQDDEARDHFDVIRQKLEIGNSKLRSNGSDFLFYTLLDAIVDNYYIVMDKLGIEIEQLEERISRGETTEYTMSAINNLRKEMIMFRRNVVPVRDVLSNLCYTENTLIEPSNRRYYKDVLDHIVQAIDLSDNYRDIVTNIRDLYVNQVNLKSNEVMKFLAIITSLLAPATVLGGIFGMNFDRLPWQHNQYGFAFVAILMIGIPLLMLTWFKKQGWF